MGIVLPYKGILPKIGERVYLAPNCVIVGDVTIGDYSSIWFGAVLRGDVEEIIVGKYTNIQDNVVVHGTKGKYNVVIGDYVTIGHNATIHATKIASHVIIGMGAILLDGSEIGEYCIVGAGAVVPPGMKVEPESLVLGIPGRVVRKITEEEKKMIDNNWKNYLEYAKDYLEGK